MRLSVSPSLWVFLCLSVCLLLSLSFPPFLFSTHQYLLTKTHEILCLKSLALQENRWIQNKHAPKVSICVKSGYIPPFTVGYYSFNIFVPLKFLRTSDLFFYLAIVEFDYVISNGRKFAPRCCVCQKPIMPDPGQEETVRIVAMDKSFHVDCYRCEVSAQVLGNLATVGNSLSKICNLSKSILYYLCKKLNWLYFLRRNFMVVWIVKNLNFFLFCKY